MGREGVVRVPGATLPYHSEGSGPPMFVLGSPTFYARALPAALREHFELVFVELRHFVPVEDGFDVTTIDFDRYADDIDGLRRAAGLERAIVLGNSIHGTIAREYAARYPQHVRGVVDLNSSPTTAVKTPTQDEFWAADATPERRAQHEVNLATRPKPDPVTSGAEWVLSYVARGAWYWYDAAFDCTPLWVGVEPNLSVFQQLTNYDVTATDIPTFLGLGRYDYVVPYVWWDPYLPRYTRLAYKLYDQSGHLPFVEQPEEFAADVAAWAGGLEP
jgi:proline iminopeptidase